MTRKEDNKLARYTAFPRMQPFNRECEFIVRRGIKVAGIDLKDGDPIDKTQLTTRRLRQLYEQRYIVQGEPKQSIPTLVPHSIDFKQLPTAAIITWLAARNKIPRPNSDRAKIIALAEVVQQKEKEADDGVVSGKSTKKSNRKGVQGAPVEGSVA